MYKSWSNKSYNKTISILNIILNFIETDANAYKSKKLILFNPGLNTELI